MIKWIPKILAVIIMIPIMIIGIGVSLFWNGYLVGKHILVKLNKKQKK